MREFKVYDEPVLRYMISLKIFETLATVGLNLLKFLSILNGHYSPRLAEII